MTVFFVSAAKANCFSQLHNSSPSGAAHTLKFKLTGDVNVVLLPQSRFGPRTLISLLVWLGFAATPEVVPPEDNIL